MLQPNQYQYNAYHAQVDAIEKAPLLDRQEARDNLKEILNKNNPNDSHKHFIKSVDWLIQGSYGYVPYYKAWNDVIKNKRMNRRAWLFTMVALLEYRVPQSFSARVWNELAPETQEWINQQLDETMEFHLSNEDG